MTPDALTPDALTGQALLNCLIREVSAPEDQALAGHGHVLIRLARSGVTLRAELRRPSAGIGPRPTGQVQVRGDRGWRVIGWRRLADLIADELILATGVTNAEFTGQVGEGHAACAAILRARAGRDADADADWTRDRIGRYLASEQALIAGHRFHPAPKARQGAPRDWLRYAPEAGARFPLRFLGVRDEVLACDGDTAGLDRLGAPDPPPGYRVLPVHPWQFRLLGRRPWLRQALSRGLVVDLGDGAREVVPTSSVRTVYDPVSDVFCKFSLNVRITNCVRKSAWYELASSVVLTRLLDPVFADLGRRFPGTVLLGEPGYRTAALSVREAYEGLAVIVRDGVAGRTWPHVTPVLAASLTEGCAFFGGRDPDWLVSWWQAYVRVVGRPVLAAFFGHGVVLEPHLQNVLIGLDDDGWPAQAIFRDLEGTKLVAARHQALLAGLAPDVARGLAYDQRRGWDRVAYCLLVNHLAEIAAAIADHVGTAVDPDKAAELERALWDQARPVLDEAAREHGWPPELRAVLAGVPLPAKANLRVRWARAADREAAYVPVRNPLHRPEPA
jgi:siderophore synthetase component